MEETTVEYRIDGRSTNTTEEAKKKKKQISVTLPDEIVFSDILTRLPVKSLLRFRSVSKLWRSLIRSPCFASLHLTRSLSNQLDGFALLISVYDWCSSMQHLLSATHWGGPTTHLLTLSNSARYHCVSENINGLICLHRRTGTRYQTQEDLNPDNSVYVCSPGTREIVKLPINFETRSSLFDVYHNFGFESSRKEHKVLSIRVNQSCTERNCLIECEIFTLGTHSWRKIYPKIPPNIRGSFGHQESVCVNDTIHWILARKGIIVAFNLRDENFHEIPLPYAATVSTPQIFTFVHGILLQTSPYIIQMNGLLTVICYEHAFKRNMIEMWILEDYNKQVWIMESVTFPSPWEGLECPVPYGTIYTGEILFAPQQTIWERISMVFVPVLFYDIKTQNFRRGQITSFPEWLSSNIVRTRCVRVYTESMLSLGRNYE